MQQALVTEKSPTTSSFLKRSSISDSHYAKGVRYVSEGQIELALDEFTDSIQSEPATLCAAFKQRALCRRQRNMFKLAFEDIKAACILNSQDNELSALYHYMGALISLHQDQDLDVACAKNTAAISFMPKDARFWNNRALCYLHMGEYEKCIADCQQALTLSKSQSATLHIMSEAHKQQAQFQKVVTDSIALQAASWRPKAKAAKESLGPSAPSGSASAPHLTTSHSHSQSEVKQGAAMPPSPSSISRPSSSVASSSPKSAVTGVVPLSPVVSPAVAALASSASLSASASNSSPRAYSSSSALSSSVSVSVPESAALPSRAAERVTSQDSLNPIRSVDDSL